MTDPSGSDAFLSTAETAEVGDDIRNSVRTFVSPSLPKNTKTTTTRKNGIVRLIQPMEIPHRVPFLSQMLTTPKRMGHC